MQENKINEEEDKYLKVTVRLSNLRTLCTPKHGGGSIVICGCCVASSKKLLFMPMISVCTIPRKTTHLEQV